MIVNIIMNNEDKMKSIIVILSTNTNLEKLVQAFDADFGTKGETLSITLKDQLFEIDLSVANTITLSAKLW